MNAFHIASDTGKDEDMTNTRKQGKKSIRTRRLVIQGLEADNVIFNEQ